MRPAGGKGLQQAGAALQPGAPSGAAGGNEQQEEQEDDEGDDEGGPDDADRLPYLDDELDDQVRGAGSGNTRHVQWQ